MIDRPPFPARFRRRLAIAFVVVAGISSGLLALGAALWIYSYRTTAFHDRSEQQVADDMRLLAAGAPPEVVASRVADAETPGGPGVVVVTAGELISSVEALDLDVLPPGMRAEVEAAPDTLVDHDIELDSGRALVIGTLSDATDVEAYFFFPRDELSRSNRELRLALIVGWFVVLGVAAIAGTVFARRTLRPVRHAADAARSVAEGLLDTRLPVRSDDEFGEWASSFNEMVSALEQKITALAEARDREQRFAADIAHELRTPITAVLTATSHLADHRLSVDGQREVAQIVADAARRLDRLTSELLELHRLESGHEELQVEAVDLVAAVRNAVRAHGWSDRVVVGGPARLVVDTDRRRLDRIMVNLVANALAHGRSNVRVTIRSSPGGASLEVSDDGPGI
ncbi:MAG TPA: HAMP domain-containing sensor histidine kinase, partial [Acidimicrobiales bacterium]|nr:HAMP domain-containing sensor histidine kinase [Acidimicrobiales bacterium]